ncbi:threonine--tRNA ligase [Candidatus Saccharibacteria bacterium]|nr:threonine--tRNA ligase [Candidatus Saccharibacteria bacterium]
MQNNNSIEAVRHSLAHLLAYSVKQLFPGSENAIGPAVENGFYQDFEIKGAISEDDLSAIEKKMKEVLKTWRGFERQEVDEAEALKIFSDNKYKQELIKEFAAGGKKITIYTSGEFVDLCKGGHVEDIKAINPSAFRLTKVAGAYWRGDEKNVMLTRIYGVAFEEKGQLTEYLQMLEEAKKRDHRKLGKELDLFVFSDLVGAGLPLFTDRGTILREELGKFTQELRERTGFRRVWTPVIAKTDLYKASGHWDKFGDELFLVKSQETSDEFVLRPMNCPHHVQLYASQPRSYRDLPLKFMENAGDYRDEKTGELHGLSRVRSFTQDDSHAFVAQEQIKSVATELVEASQEMYSVLGMSLKFRLSFRDEGEGYLGDLELWEKAQKQIEELAKENGLHYYIEEGEAAFYGPKIDFMATDAIGRQWQVATVQLDFVQPDRFSLEYVAEDGSKQQPVMIHCALLGSIERFLSVYIEHVAGRFPVWLAPEQLRVIQVKDSDELDSFTDEIMTIARERGVRVYIDRSNESVGKKIRNAELMKVPYVVVVGEKELETRELTPRLRADIAVDGREESSYAFEGFVKSIAHEAKARVQRSSL